MHLVVFGLSMTSSWGNGHATVYRSLLPALARRGHRVTFFERDVDYYARRRDRSEFPGIELILYSSWGEIRARALAQAAAAEAVMMTSFCPDGSEIQADLLGLARPLKVFYDMDTPVTLEGLARAGETTLRYLTAEHLRAFDLYLSFTGGPLLEELSGRWGARRVASLYLCADPGQHRPVAAREEFRASLSFLGTWAEDRWERMRELFLAPAMALPQERFGLAGSMYPAGISWPDNVRRWEHLAPEIHAVFHCSSRFALNLTREAMLRWGYSPQGRLFEAALCGTPVITDRWPGLDQFLEPGREVLVAESAGDVIGILRGVAAEEARRIAQRARTRVLEEHSGERRAEQLEALMEGAGAPAEAPRTASLP